MAAIISRFKLIEGTFVLSYFKIDSKVGEKIPASVVIGRRYLSAKSSRAFDKRAEQEVLKVLYEGLTPSGC